jgi:hypothetical protein
MSGPNREDFSAQANGEPRSRGRDHRSSRKIRKARRTPILVSNPRLVRRGGSTAALLAYVLT